MKGPIFTNDPIKLWKNRITSWFLACKHNLHLSKCVNKDIRKLIASYVKIDFTDGYFTNEKDERFVFGLYLDSYYWTNVDRDTIVNPCHTCLMPCVEEIHDNGQILWVDYTCNMHGVIYKFTDFCNGTNHTDIYIDCKLCCAKGMTVECVKSKKNYLV